jgi:phosphoadenosine phosphosulfate reductase
MRPPFPPHPQDILFESLEAKVEKSLEVIGRALARFPAETLAVAWTGGKDSTLLVHLFAVAAAAAGRGMPPLLFIDDGDMFPEVAAFVAQTRTDWDAPFFAVRNDDLLEAGLAVGQWVETAGLSSRNRLELARIGFSGQGFFFDPEALPGSHLAKTTPLNRFIEERGLAALATGIRWDEHEARMGEEYFSPRAAPPHIRVHPLLHFRERDVWDFTFSRGLPFCELYRAGYRSLGTRSGTAKGSDAPAWEQDLEHTPERAGRDQGKESAMAQLRALGYM